MADEADASGVAMLFFDLIESAEFESGASDGLVSGKPTPYVSVDLLFQMEPQLVVELLVDVGPSQE
jgi:hypothetical protein